MSITSISNLASRAAAGHGMGFLAALVLATGLAAGPQAAHAAGVSGGLCVNDRWMAGDDNAPGGGDDNNQNVTCTANDVQFGQVVDVSVIDGCDSPTDTATFSFRVEVEVTGQDRYDIGIYLSENGESAEVGSVCFADDLPTPTEVDLNTLCAGAGVPLACCTGIGTGTCAYTDLDSDVTPGDVCGDISKAAGFTNPLIADLGPVTVACIDLDNNGFLDIPNCTTWRQKSEGEPKLCGGPMDAFPGAPSKCNCEGIIELTDIPIPKSIEVVKDLDPDTDPGLFDLDVDGGDPEFVDAREGDSTGKVSVEAGLRTVSESAGTGTNLSAYDSSIVCEDQVGRCVSDPTAHCVVDLQCDVLDGDVDGSDTCDLTPTTVGSCASCTSIDVDVADAVSDIVCTITNVRVDPCDPLPDCSAFNTDCGIAACDPNGAVGNCDALDPVTDGRTCRVAADVCDVAEICDGMDTTCPVDGFVAGGTTCRDAAGECDLAEVCTGTGASCPADAKSTATCRGAADVCDVEEVCDGASNDCPADGFVAGGTTCRDAAGECDLAEVCTGTGASCPADAKSTATCRGAADVCDVEEVCDGASNDCPADGFVDQGTECRSAAGECDLAEVCTGTGASCPADAKSTATCRGAADVCDVEEVCDGASNDCPADGFVDQGTECRSAAGECDLAEVCTGTGASCPADAKSTATCRGAADVCDVEEVCDGASNDCPADGFVAGGTTCRDAAGECDLAEVCTGTGASCPADAKSTATCRGAADVCDVEEVCDGASNDCPADGFVDQGTECRSAAGECDLAEVCTGTGASCPADAKSTATCRGAADVCDVEEVCDGASNDCPADGFVAGGTTCRDAAGECDLAEACTGTGAACPNDEKSTDLCRAAVDVCDVAEVCDGASNDCPADGFVDQGTECRSAAGECDVAEACTGTGAACPNDEKSTDLCRAAVDVCDVAEVCDGASNDCPADGFVDQGTECREAGGDCDLAEVCTGTGASCPADAKSTDLCRAAVDVCDVAEVCDGASNDCPADGFVDQGTECRSAAGECDVAEACTGTGAACPNDEKSTDLCRAAVDVCDVDEFCNGVDDDCPADEFADPETPCNDGDDCTGPEDTCDGSGNCVGEEIQPTVKVIKQVINDNGGNSEADDFLLSLNGDEFRVVPDPADPTMGMATFEVDDGQSFVVTEILGELADFYEPTFDSECGGTATCLDPDLVCTVTNDDIRRNRNSVEIDSLSIAVEDGMHLLGSFVVTDESESGSMPDGVFVLLDDPQVDWEYKRGRGGKYEPSDANGPAGGSFEVQGSLVTYTCEYEILDVDGAPGPADYETGDAVVFDESVTIGYTCWLSEPLPTSGFLRGTASAEVFSRGGRVFKYREDLAL